MTIVWRIMLYYRNALLSTIKSVIIKRLMLLYILYYNKYHDILAFIYRPALVVMPTEIKKK